MRELRTLLFIICRLSELHRFGFTRADFIIEWIFDVPNREDDSCDDGRTCEGVEVRGAEKLSSKNMGFIHPVHVPEFLHADHRHVSLHLLVRKRYGGSGKGAPAKAEQSI